jgi:uncharacterized membrane protein YfcA
MDIVSILIIAGIICLGFGVESTFGIAGNVIAITLLLYLFDIKDMVVLVAFASSIASFGIILSHPTAFDKRTFFRTLIWGIPGVLLGTFFLKSFSSDLLLSLFAGLLILFAVWTLFFPDIAIPKKIRPLVNFIGGIVGGMFGTPGPFFVTAIRDSFGGKLPMRVTLAVLFLALNAIRIPIYFYNGIVEPIEILPFAWIIIPLSLTIWAGYHLHLKISEKNFQIGVSFLLILSGISFLLQ